MNSLSCIPYHIKILFLILFCLTYPINATSEEGGEATKESTSKTPPSPPQEDTELVQIVTLATLLPKELIDIKSDLENRYDISEIEKKLPKLISGVKELQWDSNSANTNPDIQLMEISTHQNNVHRFSTKLTNMQDPIKNIIGELSNKQNWWLKKQNDIKTLTRKTANSFDISKNQLQALQKTTITALDIIEKRLTRSLDLGRRVTNIQTQLYEIETNLKKLSNEKISVSINQTSPSMLSPHFYKKIQPNIFLHALTNSVLVYKFQLGLLKKNYRLLIAILFILAFISFLLRQSEKITPASSHWHPFATCFIATAVFMSTTFYTLISMAGETYQIPYQWQMIIYVFILLAVIRLTKHLVNNSFQRDLLIPLSLFMIFLICMVFLNIPQFVMFIYVFYVSLISIFLYLYQLTQIKKLQKRDKAIRIGMCCIAALVVISGIFGYDQFAVIIFSTVLSSITGGLITWVLYKFFLGLLDFLLIITPFSLLKENREKIVVRIKPIIALLHLLLLFAIQLVVWDVYGTVSEAMQMIFDKGFTIGGLKISPGFFLTIIFIFYTTLLISRGIQALLLARVLPQYGAKKGVQLSIARLVHYAIIFVGFLVVLRVLGFNLNQLTILGGALGVGIGFGLQAIVNNFASGLILLFERPIKVGDTIQVGTDLGEVKNMGLRATVIQTFDNAEIVVPNSDLITGQVTNWTLSERKVRVRVNVGVAYGSDISKVLETLLGCANNNPMVLTTPTPLAYFLAFGSSSLDFELRVWIPEFLDKTQVLSELNQDIENEFAILGIEVPFPQTDLHLRSVDPIAGTHLTAKTGNIS